MISKDELARLQGKILEALFHGSNLPGSAEPLTMPDLGFVTRQDSIYLSSENLCSGVGIPDTDKSLRIVSSNELQHKARSTDRMAFLQFGEMQEGGDTIVIPVEIKLATKTTGQPQLGLSKALLRFKRSGQDWVLDGTPTYLAS